MEILDQVLFGKITVLMLLEGAFGLFVIASIASRLMRPSRQRLIPKRCTSCDWRAAVSAETSRCPRCKAAIRPV